MTKYTPEQRIAAFWSKVDKFGGDDACWIWMHKDGRNQCYGRYRWDGVRDGAHRIAYRLTYGDFDPSLYVLHNCPDGDRPLCVNPQHLWLGTPLDNMQDMVAKGRGVHFFGEKNPSAKLTDAQVREIRERAKSGEWGIQAGLAREYSVSPARICTILKGQR